MKESTLWEHLKPDLKKLGKFQKISDRFTPGVPDVIGCMDGIPYALELKELHGVHILKARFRPGQIDWLKDWVIAGGVGLIVVTQGTHVMAFDPDDGFQLAEGVTPSWAQERSLVSFVKTRHTSWNELVKQLWGIRNEPN